MGVHSGEASLQVCHHRWQAVPHLYGHAAIGHNRGVQLLHAHGGIQPPTRLGQECPQKQGIVLHSNRRRDVYVV